MKIIKNKKYYFNIHKARVKFGSFTVNTLVSIPSIKDKDNPDFKWYIKILGETKMYYKIEMEKHTYIKKISKKNLKEFFEKHSLHIKRGNKVKNLIKNNG